MEGLYQALVAVEPTTLVVTILNLFLQIYLVKRLFLNKLLNILDKRRELVEKELSEAETAKQQAQGEYQAYEDDRARLRERAGEILDQANRTASARSEEIIHQAKQQAEQLRVKASDEIAREKKKAIKEAKDAISQIALSIAGKVIGRNLDEPAQARLVDRFIEELGEGE